MVSWVNSAAGAGLSFPAVHVRLPNALRPPPTGFGCSFRQESPYRHVPFRKKSQTGIQGCVRDYGSGPVWVVKWREEESGLNHEPGLARTQ